MCPTLLQYKDCGAFMVEDDALHGVLAREPLYIYGNIHDRSINLECTRELYIKNLPYFFRANFPFEPRNFTKGKEQRRRLANFQFMQKRGN